MTKGKAKEIRKVEYLKRKRGYPFLEKSKQQPRAFSRVQLLYKATICIFYVQQSFGRIQGLSKAPCTCNNLFAVVILIGNFMTLLSSISCI